MILSVRLSGVLCLFAAAVGCAPASDEVDEADGVDIVKDAPVASVDRFQDGFATLFKRSGPAFDPANVQPIIPGPNEAFDVDALFRVPAFGPAGELINYYSFDIVSDIPQRGYFFVDDNGGAIAGQLPILSSLPSAGSSDFVIVTEVTVGPDYMRNSLQSVDEVEAAAAAGSVTLAETTRIENWVIVPEGTTASGSFAGKAIPTELAWVDGEVAHALTFEKNLERAGDRVPTSGIVVIFAGENGPADGFATDDNGRTHTPLRPLLATQATRRCGFIKSAAWTASMA